MIKRGIYGFCMQEKWLLGSFFTTIRGHLLLNHGMANKACRRAQTSSIVAIILGYALIRAWDMSVKTLPIIPPINSNFLGRMIGVTLWFSNQPNKKLDRYHKRSIGKIYIFMSSIYHPMDHTEQKRFNEELASLYNAIPRNSELLSSQDIKTNISVW